MNKYRIIFVCADGYEGEEYVMAVNRIMALECFKAFGYSDVVAAEAFRVLDEDTE